MTGAAEILVLILLILVILILPRLFKPVPQNKNIYPRQLPCLRPVTRAGIILTLIYPVGMSLYFKPWEGNLVAFLAFGVLPVFLSWSLVWILSGRKN
ncbi:MAG: hypothetical protein ABIJ31_10825 [Pseudomonadota bacterium]